MVNPNMQVIRKIYTVYVRSDEEALERAEFDKYFYGCDAALHRLTPQREVLALREVPTPVLDTLQCLPDDFDQHGHNVYAADSDGPEQYTIVPLDAEGQEVWGWAYTVATRADWPANATPCFEEA